MKVKELSEKFNPEAELLVQFKDNSPAIKVDDVIWDNKDSKISLKGLASSMKDSGRVILMPQQEIKTTYAIPDSAVCQASQPNVTKQGPEGTMRTTVDDIPYIDCDKVVLSCKFKVKKIKKSSSAFVKDLGLSVGNLVVIDMPLKNSRSGRKINATYVIVYNTYNGKRKEVSLNMLYKHIYDSLEIYRVV